MARAAKDEPQTDQPELKIDRVSVINRRLANPFGAPSRDIPLKGEKRGWVVRTFVADKEHANRHYDAVHVYGYVPLTEADLSVKPESIGYTVSPSGYIVRGTHGEELLCAIPRKEYEAIQKAKSDRNLKGLQLGRLKQDVAEHVGKELGQEAGERVADNFTVTASQPITETI